MPAPSTINIVRETLSWHYLAKSGAPIWEAICTGTDEVMLAAYDAVKARLPSHAPLDALPRIADDENLDYYPAAMGLAGIREYLATPFSKWRRAGTRRRLLEEVALIGFPSAAIISWRDLADGGNPGAFGGVFTNFWYLIIKPPHPFKGPIKWDGGDVWDGGAQWDLQASPEVLDQLRRAIEKWKPAGSSCRYIEIWLSVGPFGLPDAIARIPVWELWEYDDRGHAVDLYNSGY